MYFIVRSPLRFRLPIVLLSTIVVPFSLSAAQSASPEPPRQPAAETATVVVLNDSGKALFSGDQKVEDNGETLVSLSRHEFQRVSIAPGRHVFQLPHRRNPHVVLEAEPGRTYYLLVAYKPERSYFGPFLGSPFVLKEIPEETARTLMEEMGEKTGAGGESTSRQPAGDSTTRQPAGVSRLSMHAPPSPRQTPGVTLRLEEQERTPGRKGTRVTYAIQTSGFPEGRTFQLLHSSLATKHERSAVVTGIHADASGALVGGSVAIERLSMIIDDYNKGEPLTLEVVADDKSVYARDTVYPFPIVAREGGCQVWAELVNRNRKSFALQGNGFRPGERVQIRSTDGHDPKEWTATADESGRIFAAIDHGRSGGTGVFTAAGEDCRVTLTYEFGKKAKGPM